MSFKDLLQKEVSKAQDNNGGNSDRYKSPNGFLALGKGFGYEKLVRVLPTIQPDGHFGVMVRKGLLQVGFDQNNKPKFQTVQVPYEEYDTYQENKVNQWVSEGVYLGKYGVKIKPAFYINVVELVNNGGSYDYAKNDDGQIKIQVLEIPKTAYDSLMKQLNDDMQRPQGCESEYSFVSETHGSPVRFEKPKQGSGVMQWTVTSYPQAAGNIPPLPQGWETQAADLQKIGEPTSLEDFKNFIEKPVEGTQGVEPTQSEPTQQQIDSQLPDNLGSNVPPQAPQQQVPPTQNSTYTNLGQQPQQQVPQQPVQQQVPQQSQVGEYAQPGVNQTPTQQQSQPLPGTQQPIDNTQQGQGNPFEGFDPSQNNNVQQPQQPQQQPQQQPVNNQQEPPAQPNNLPDDVEQLLSGIINE